MLHDKFLHSLSVWPRKREFFKGEIKKIVPQEIQNHCFLKDEKNINEKFYAAITIAMK